MQTFKIIVAAYNENLDWLDKINQSDVIIYNKSDKIIENSIKLENIGREAATYFYHIINNYDNLPDYLILLQGNPFEHMEKNINEFNLKNEIETLIENNNSLSGLFNELCYENNNKYPNLNTSAYFLYFFNNNLPKFFVFLAGCQYIVSKENILNRPLQFYKKIYKMLLNNNITVSNDAHYNKNIFDEKSINAWTVERLMMYIFDKSIMLNPLNLDDH